MFFFFVEVVSGPVLSLYKVIVHRVVSAFVVQCLSSLVLNFSFLVPKVRVFLFSLSKT